MKRQMGDFDNNLDLENKAKQLLEILVKNHDNGDNNISYLMFVLQSWYDDGYYEALRIFFKEKEGEDGN